MTDVKEFRELRLLMKLQACSVMPHARCIFYFSTAQWQNVIPPLVVLLFRSLTRAIIDSIDI